MLSRFVSFEIFRSSKIKNKRKENDLCVALSISMAIFTLDTHLKNSVKNILYSIDIN